MSTIRTSISISERLYREAQAAADAENFRSFSDYIEHLIREDWKARQGFTDQSPPYRPSATATPIAAVEAAAQAAGETVAPTKKRAGKPLKT